MQDRLCTEVTSIKDSSAELVVDDTPQASSAIVGPLKHETQVFASLPGTTIAKIGMWLLIIHGTMVLSSQLPCQV